MFRMDTNRRVAVLAVIVVLSLGSPLAAAGWELPASWSSSGELLKGFSRVLIWLGVTLPPGLALKCNGGMGIDPDGCPKALSGDCGGSIDPGGAHGAASDAGVRTDGGMSIDPDGLH